ncbi:MAG TPA: N-acetyltransferase [Microscillaceae bacterium]|nr:N-acetyltransferase [Microscillaceae bacterium]
MITIATPQDWETIKAIYIEGMNTHNATFETPDQVSTYEKWIKNKIAEAVFVYRQDQEILGWAALYQVSSRCVYAGVVELSIYIGAKARGKGIGSALMQHLIHYTETHNIWSIQSGMFPENQGSKALHTKFGFREVGTKEKIGKMNGQWRDVLYMERRSSTIF